MLGNICDVIKQNKPELANIDLFLDIANNIISFYLYFIILNSGYCL